ncbi:hypothetical protein GIB67_001063 [Kingdonia uniflora]|uniref:Uncharacterized protein n=1 Tax=Kingdonia uniflora TaxID=39325 RepID=A0A7J7MGB7_9MAGN|nr:hypothetical protein GIB67_001063 [Kingdonia uniflora]
MDEIQKFFVPKVNLDEMNKPPTPRSPRPRSRTLVKQTSAKMNCLCSPTTHAGSFRCRLHRSASSMGLSRTGGSIGSNLSELAAKTAAISDSLHSNTQTYAKS